MEIGDRSSGGRVIAKSRFRFALQRLGAAVAWVEKGGPFAGPDVMTVLIAVRAEAPARNCVTQRQIQRASCTFQSSTGRSESELLQRTGKFPVPLIPGEGQKSSRFLTFLVL